MIDEQDYIAVKYKSKGKSVAKSYFLHILKVSSAKILEEKEHKKNNDNAQRQRIT